MADQSQGRSQDQTQARTGQQENRQTRSSGGNPASQPQAPEAPRQAVEIKPLAQQKARATFKAGQATITAGQAGARNLNYRWIDVPFPDYDSARFDVASAAPNAIEAEIQQDLYKKKYTGTGAISTSPVPRAPFGTKGKMIVRDTVTGEAIEVPWTWHDKGGSSFSLWQMIKRLIWKGDS